MTEAELRAQIDEAKAKRRGLPPGDERSALNVRIGELTGQIWKLRKEKKGNG